MANILLKENKYGQKIWVDENESIGKAIIKKGIYDANGIHYINKILQLIDAPICLDIGANIGNHALIMARHSKKVYCFEPQTDIVNLLKKTINENNIKNMEIFCLGLSDKNEKLTFYKNLDGNGGSSTFIADLKGTNYQIENFECRVGDEIIEQNRIEKIDFIKIDVEGFEAHSLSGLKNSILKFRPIIMMEWNNQVTKEKFQQHDLFNTLFKNYEIHSILNNHHRYYWGKRWFSRTARVFYRKLTKKRPLLYHFDRKLNYTNILFIPPERKWVADLK
jgi:FkbM family methyltransferase